MNETTEVAKQESKEVTREQARRQVPDLLPPVDIYEDDSGITVTADLPGVNTERLNVQINHDTLLIEGEASLDIPQEMEPHYADVRTTHYRRSFALSSELDTEAVQANLKDGVLTVRLPKRAAYQPRKIEIQTA